jgi:hypothetical protein
MANPNVAPDGRFNLDAVAGQIVTLLAAFMFVDVFVGGVDV